MRLHPVLLIAPLAASCDLAYPPAHQLAGSTFVGLDLPIALHIEATDRGLDEGRLLVKSCRWRPEDVGEDGAAYGWYDPREQTLFLPDESRSPFQIEVRDDALWLMGTRGEEPLSYAIAASWAEATAAAPLGTCGAVCPTDPQVDTVVDVDGAPSSSAFACHAWCTAPGYPWSDCAYTPGSDQAPPQCTCARITDM